MDIKGIIAISGKPGLFKVAAQGRNNIIVESLDTGKKFPAFATDKISALEDICIYTYEEDVPLIDVYEKLAEKEGYKASISHKEAPAKLREHIQSYLPDYDEDRVYDQDLKKLYQHIDKLDFDSANKMPVALWIIRVSEIQAVCNCRRSPS